MLRPFLKTIFSLYHNRLSSPENLMGEKHVETSTFVGTNAYQPPELREGQSYNPAAFDVWSLGVISFYLVVRLNINTYH